MFAVINDSALDQLFRSARTHSAWLNRSVDPALLQSIFDLMIMAPTSVNCSPLRIVYLVSPDAKSRLKPHLDAGNLDKTMTAPVTAILAQDMEFYKHLPVLFPHTDAKAWFEGNQTLINSTATRNATLQGGYFIMAARAMGLDCGPMSGFDNAGVDAEFFAGTPVKSNFLCNLGYGDPSKLYPRSPRFSFADICTVL